MNWEQTDLFSNEGEIKLAQLEGFDTTNSMLVENEEKESIQLKKYQSPTQSPQRQAYIEILKDFGVLLTRNAIEEIASTLLTDDCKVYAFNATGRPSMQFCLTEVEYSRLYDNIQVKERIIKETAVDLEKDIAWQISHCKVLYEGELLDEVWYEIFTFEDEKICKYRATYAPIIPSLHGTGDIFQSTKKDRMIAKVKEINYALAGNPNFEKVQSLLNEKTEYKIWGWDSQKCVTLDKINFVSGFKDLQKNLRITSIVPYEMVSEGCSVAANYAYHLEEVAGERKKYIWLSSAGFMFDCNDNIIRANQMGEIHAEDEDFMPFEVYSRETIVKRVNDIYAQLKPEMMDLWYSDLVYFACDILKFGPRDVLHHGRMEGLRDLGKMPPPEKKCWNIERLNPLDISVDHHDPSYDVVSVIAYAEGTTNFEGDPNNGQKVRLVNFHRLVFENGKLIKMGLFFSDCVSEALDKDPNFCKF